MEQFYQKNTFLSFYDGKKVDAPILCTIRQLDWQDVSKVLELQKTILDELGADQTFLSVNKAADFQPYLNRQKGMMLGVFENKTNQLIAVQSLKKEHVADVKIEDITSEPVACLASFMVRKDFRGNHLTPILMGHLTHIAATEYHINNFIAYVDARNPASYTHCQQRGFGIFKAYYDDVFHAPSYAFVLSDDEKVNDKLYFPDTILKPNHFEEVRQIIENGKCCVAKHSTLQGKINDRIINERCKDFE